MLASLLFAATVWPHAVTQYCKPAETTILVGVAHSPSGDFLYCEQMEQTTEHVLNVSYVRDGKTFAEKKLMFLGKPEIPSVEQKDFRSGEVRKADLTTKTVNLQYQANNRKKNTQVSLPQKEVDVVDAGFDNFIRSHWDDLQAGKILSVNFASMSHLKVLPLRISAQASVKCAVTNESFCLLVEIDNALLRIVLGNIKLTYDQQHRLISFNGVVNIEDDKEATQTAKISYYYQTDYRENK